MGQVKGRQVRGKKSKKGEEESGSTLEQKQPIKINEYNYILVIYFTSFGAPPPL